MTLRAPQLLRATAGAVFAFLWLMVPPSFFLYTSLGLGRDRPGKDMVIHEFFRVRWPGNGSVAFVLGRDYILTPGEDIDWIDFAFRMFRPPQRPVPRSRANRLGFWDLRLDEHHGSDVLEQTHWLAVPSALPPLALTPLWLWEVRRRRNARAASAESGYR